MFYFAFLLVSLVSNFKIALNANQILFPCITKTMSKRVVFLSCLAKSQKCWLKKILPLFFILSLDGSRAWSRACAIFFSFSQDYKYICIYIYTYIYVYIHLYLSHDQIFFFLFVVWPRFLLGKGGVLPYFIFFLFSLAPIFNAQ